jgi:hypothetical protein
MGPPPPYYLAHMSLERQDTLSSSSSQPLAVRHGNAPHLNTHIH